MSRLIKTFIFSIIFCTLALNTIAQNQSKQADSSEKQILFQVDIMKVDTTANFMKLPTEIMDKLIKHDALHSADINYRINRYLVNATFEFKDMADFRNWYESEEATALLKTFRKDFDRLEIKFQLFR